MYQVDIDCAEICRLLSHCFQRFCAWTSLLNEWCWICEACAEEYEKHSHNGALQKMRRSLQVLCWRMQRYGLKQEDWKLSWFKTKWNTKSNIVFWCSFWYSKTSGQINLYIIADVISNTSIKIMLGLFRFLYKTKCFNVGIPFFSQVKPGRMYKATQEWSYNHPIQRRDYSQAL